MSDWFEEVAAEAPLMQGDIIKSCPLLAWRAAPANLTLDEDRRDETLSNATEFRIGDVVVLTQACDLEQNKVTNVVLCPCIGASEYYEWWSESRRRENKKADNKAWESHWRSVCNGFSWNLTALNRTTVGSGECEHRVVDFHEIYSIPRVFIESLLVQRGQKRLRLLPPYREHLSQAFARYFMRVGLPVSVSPLTNIPPH